ncbi:FecCD family ABC transporter permease [Paraburkholderia tropica]|uniref:FecCD family ABC transporter permease n=1 Tax=Paraburkholderia tropica TaxID=92647 RepID=UPI003D27DC44
MSGFAARFGARPAFALSVAALCVPLAGLIGLCAGRYPLAPEQVALTVLAALHLHAWPAHGALLHAVVMEARLPRLVAAALIGAALCVSGTTCQAVFRNPLVSPGMLGVLSGAAFGAALAIVLGGAVVHRLWVEAGAFAGGVAAMAVGVSAAAMLGGEPEEGALARGGILALLLGGLVSNALFSALVSLLKYVADPLNQLPAIVYWLLGSLAQTGWADLTWATAPLALGTLLLCLAAPLIDGLTLSDDEARSLGVPVQAIRFAVMALATLIAALTVALAGMIGWIGLLVPNLVRPLVGASNRVVLPMSALVGAIALMLADTCARSVASAEIPLGVITEMGGALAFVFVLRALRRRAR